MRLIPRPLAALLGVYFLLALLFNWASPLFENSDEFFHFPFIKYLSDHNGYLPLQSGHDLQDWRQQGSQPPIYHLIAALLIKPINTDDYAEVRRPNLHAQIGVVGDSNINAVLHPLDRSAEFGGGTALAVRVVRIFSTLLAGVVVACAYWMTRLIFPDLPPRVGLLAAGLVAFNPMYLFVASSINNDNMSNALICTVLTLLVWLYQRPERPSPQVLMLIGGLLGLSLISKLSTGPFMGLVGLFWLALAYRHAAWAYMVKWGFGAGVLASFIGGWWYIRNYDLYGDPTGLNVFLDIVGRRPIPLTAEQLWSEREGFIQSFWGLYGGMTVPMAAWTYPLLSGLAVVSLVGAVAVFLRERKLDLSRVVLILWPIMALISLVRWTALTWATQGRLWFIAITCLATLSAIGFYEIERRFKVRYLAFLPLAVSLAIAIIAPFAWIIPAYAAPELLPITAGGGMKIYHDPEYPAESLELRDAVLPDEVRAGQPAEIQLEFCAPDDLSRNWSVFVHLTNPWDIILAQADFTPGGGALPTAEMPAGYCWRDVYAVQIPAGVVSEDTPLKAWVGLYEAQTGIRMNLADNPAQTRFEVAQLRLRVGDELLKFVLGDAVRVRGYELSAATAQPDTALTLTIDWEILRPLEKDYTVFVQLLNPATAYRAAASDQAPMGGTVAWQRGEIIQDSHTLHIAPDAPAGVYAVIVGFYERTPDGGFARLRVAYDGIDTGYDYLTLTQVRVD